jgi:hypothetical protein
VPERKQWRPSEKGGGGREIYTAVSGGKSGGNPSEMARALAVQGLRSRALAAAPREPGPAETLVSGVPPGSGRRGHFARAGPGWGEGQATEQARVAPGEPGPAPCGLPNSP